MQQGKVNPTTPSQLTPYQLVTVMAATNQLEVHTKGKGQFNIVETKELCCIIKEHLPIGSDRWQQVANEYNSIAVAHLQMSELEKVSLPLFCCFAFALN